jgi:hypothetical protein
VRVFDSQFNLLSKHLAALLDDLKQDPSAAEPWAHARNALGESRKAEPDLAAAIDARDAATLRAILEAWKSGKRQLPEQDREVLRRAVKAFRKSLKITRLDAESSIGANPMTSGRASSIVGMVPPTRYPRDVWDELVRQGRMSGGKHGIYELPPE